MPAGIIPFAIISETQLPPSSIVGKPIRRDKKKGKPTLVNLLGYKKTVDFANNLKNRIDKKINNYGIKSQDLLQSVEFILDRKA